MNPLLQPYIKVTEFLGRVYGPDYEIALHDLTDKNHTVIAIANGHVSGRQVGSPPTNFMLKMLMDHSYETKDFNLHYNGVSVNGKKLRSSTLFIKDGNKLIGLLCINFNDSRYQALSDEIMHLCHPDDFVEMAFQIDEKRVNSQKNDNQMEILHTSIDSATESAVMRELSLLDTTPDRLTSGERFAIVSTLSADGIFLLKGAVEDVATALHCSKASIYRYLARIKKDTVQD